MFPVLRPARQRDAAYALLMAVLCVLCADFYLWGEGGLAAAAANVLLWLCAVLYLRPHRRRATVFGLFCLLVYPLAAASMAFSDAASMKTLVVLSLPLLSSLALLELMGLRAGQPPLAPVQQTRGPVGDLAFVCFALPFGSIGRTCYALFHGEDADGQSRRRQIGSVLLGLACAIPVLLVVVPLLVSSDAAFAGLLRRLNAAHIAELLLAAALGLFAFLLVFGRLFSAQGYLPPARKTPSDRGMEPVVLSSFLSVLCAVYALYLLTQLAYFFSAFEGLLPADYSAAQYARRGFFEMAVICAINLLLLLGVNCVSRKRAGRPPLAVRLLSALLCVFSLLLIATAASKMLLYIDRYGMTRQRVETSVFMLFLAVLFVALLVRMFWSRVACLKIAVVTASLLLLAACYADVDRVVAGYNVRAWQSGRLETLDMEHLDQLRSDAVVPYLLELLDAPEEAIAQTARAQLSSRFAQHFTQYAARNYEDIDWRADEKPQDWRAWNLTSARARQLLWENRERFLPMRQKTT